MCITMAKTIQEERLRWVKPIAIDEVRLIDAAKLCPYGKRSLERWLVAYKQGGAEALTPRSTRPKTSPRETAIRIKERVIELRKNKKRCAFKLAIALQEEGISINCRTIGKILHNEHLTRRYRVKRVKYKYLRAKLQPGELMEIDVKYVPGLIANKRYYQYTAIDCASRWRYLTVYLEEDSYQSVLFLQEVIARFPHKISAVKTDNGSIFTNYYLGTNKRSDLNVKTLHAFDIFCGRQGIIHYLIDPGKPAQNGKVERSHRSDQESFYDQQTFLSFQDLQKKLRNWNMEYNDLAHCGLDGKTPNQFLREYKLMNPPNVCA